jgi:hypothetical protein
MIPSIEFGTKKERDNYPFIVKCEVDMSVPETSLNSIIL